MKKLLLALILFPTLALAEEPASEYIGGTALEVEGDAQFERMLESSFEKAGSAEMIPFDEVDNQTPAGK